jgi:hypothetical protein
LTATKGDSPSIRPGQSAIPSLAHIVAQKEALTDARWDDYANSLKGLYIDSWRGTVDSVDNDFLIDQFYSMNLDLSSSSFGMKLELSKDAALEISKGQKFIVSGTLRSIDCILGFCTVTLDNATYR